MEVSSIKHNVINLPNLTPLRAIAAMAVVVFHFNEISIVFVTQQQSMLLRKCYMMVDLFFIMSGFIMLHVYGESFSKAVNWKSFAKFIKARFARLYPLHFFLLLVLVILYFPPSADNPILTRINSFGAIISNLLLIQSFGLHDIFTWNVPSWSISAEWWAYMVFPFLAVLLARKKRIAIILIPLLAVGIYVSILYLLPRTNPFAPDIPYLDHDLDVTFDYGFLRGLAGFMMGMMTYIAYQNKRVYQFFSKDIICLVCIVVLIIAMHFGLLDLVYIPLFMLLVLCFSANENYLAKICESRSLQYLGDISYSIYMVHFFLLFTVGGYMVKKLLPIENEHEKVSFLTGFSISLLFLGFVIIVSSITYYLIEKPCRRWLNKKFN